MAQTLSRCVARAPGSNCWCKHTPSITGVKICPSPCFSLPTAASARSESDLFSCSIYREIVCWGKSRHLGSGWQHCLSKHGQRLLFLKQKESNQKRRNCATCWPAVTPLPLHALQRLLTIPLQNTKQPVKRGENTIRARMWTYK